MKEVVINNCFGGFSLSVAGMRRYCELKGIECHVYKHTPGEWGSYEPAEDGDNSIFITFFKSPAPEGKLPGNWFSENLISNYDIPRDDPDLVSVVKELGSAASGMCAELKVVEIPEDAKWHIEEYDGNEHIAEDHRTWS